MFLVLRCFLLLRPSWCASSVPVVFGAPIPGLLFVFFCRFCCVYVIGGLCVIVCGYGRAYVCMLVVITPLLLRRSLVVLLVVMLALLWNQLRSLGILVLFFNVLSLSVTTFCRLLFVITPLEFIPLVGC